MKNTNTVRHIIGFSILAALIAISFSASISAKTTKPISKSEFAIELAKSLNLIQSNSENCYKDLDPKDEKSSYICALKKAKIFTGGSKTSFSPDAKATFSFAVKSACRAYKWTKKASISSCKAYAKKNNIRTVADILKKSSAPEINNDNTTKITQDTGTSSSPKDLSAFLAVPERQTAALDFTPVASGNLDANFWDGVTLTAPLPTNFYLDEVYFIEGQLSSGSAKEVFVFLCREGKGCDDSINFLEKTLDTQEHFRVPVHFEETGNFEIGMIAGRSGQSVVENISVLPDPPSSLLQSSNGQIPTMLSAEYSGGKTAFLWDPTSTFLRLVIFQENRRRDYLFRQAIKSYTPKSVDFDDFKKGKAGFALIQNEISSPVVALNLTLQEFRKIQEDKIQIKVLKETFSEPGHFTFKGKAKIPLSKNAVITWPDGTVKTLGIADEDIKPDQEFTIETELPTLGTYIFEVNSTQGDAVINVPIFVGLETPLLPDFFALNPSELDITPIEDLTKARKQMLALINKDRKEYFIPPVKLSDEINVTAQGHSEDMVARNFFGHVNPSGESADDRRKKAKISTAIRENLGKATTLELVEAGLMRSPAHRDAILDTSMTRVGIGIVKDKEGYFIITQNFAENPLFQNDLPPLAASLLQKALEFGLSADQTLNEVAAEWSSRMASEGFFDTKNSSGKSLGSEVRGRGINNGLQLNIVKVSQKSQLEEELLKQKGLQNQVNHSIGIGLGINSEGEIFMTVIYAE